MTHMYDPPSGWQFGFPKPWPAGLAKNTETIRQQLVQDGYPETAADFGSRYCRFIGTRKRTYEEWLTAVDVVMLANHAVSLDDLPDWLSRDAFDAGLTPLEGADACLEEIGWFDELLVDEP